MAPRASLQSSVSSAEDSSAYSGRCTPSKSSDMGNGTQSLKKDDIGDTPYWRLLDTSELNRLPWAQRIEGKINLFDEPVEREFLDVFVPGPGPSKQLPQKDLMYTFKTFDIKCKQGEECSKLISGLRYLVQEFNAENKPVFAEGSLCRVSFPLEAWDRDRNYTIPGIIMSLSGNSDTKWARTWQEISTVFEVKPDGSEDPVDESSATIKTDALPIRGLIQIAKSARNLLHTHRLLYAYVVGIYSDKARIYRFDHAAGVISKAIDLEKDPYLYDFLWRFCHYEHSCQPTSEQQRTAEPGIVLGMEPTITPASEADCDKVDQLLQTSSPPQKPLTKDERKACRWVSVVTEYNHDGSAKTTKRYIMYRVRFLTLRMFSRATRVSDAYEAETWERPAMKDAWRQLARDREDVLYDKLRDTLRQRDDLEKLVDECKTFGLPCADSATGADSGIRSDGRPHSTAADKELKDKVNDEGAPTHASDLATVSESPLYGLPGVEAGDDLGAREARKLLDMKCNDTGPSSPSEANFNFLALGEADRPPGYDVYHRTVCARLRDESWEEAKFNDRSHMRLVMKTVGRPLSSFKSTRVLVTAIRDAILGHRQAFIAGLIHRNLSDGNVMIHDGGMFSGVLLDLDYAFDWMEALELAGRPVDKEAWAAYVEEYNRSVDHFRRPECSVDDVPTLYAGRDMPSGSGVDPATSWAQRMKINLKRTGTLFFMAAQVLRTFVAHDFRHDLESAIWLLLYMVLRHTLQVHVRTKKELDRKNSYLEHFGATGELGSYEKKISYITDSITWRVKDNKPLTKLIVDLRVLLVMQNRPLEWGGPIPLTYESVLTVFNQALASPDWPANDVTLGFTLPGTGTSSGSGSQGTKHPRQNESEGEGKDGDPADEGDQPPAKRSMFGPSPLRNEVGANPPVEASDNDDVFN
ncbi:hypothetical protein FOMPIDRAFT_1052476 [Fomitopsis schrenkii]|uniref:Fungal-type protein kinase domain-containing protein n=1 Tax=Fomitopsis schrenkii TaxID=2126942 RepID=S8FFS8_FOMSC|nr:hypothetical protein FOMPIDRAFT_1052476 [Fomitopsis schrenkii]